MVKKDKEKFIHQKGDAMYLASHIVDFKSAGRHFCRIVNHKSNHRVQIEDLFCG